ncbi:MAG: hypothetical protein LPK80_03475 [Bacteroidota bacterium]|nr:hypothetical protein [Bacteroidota bacterium]
MLRTVFIILLLIHALIHSMGFIKGMGWAKMEQLSQPISRGWGLMWFLASLLFLTTLGTFWVDRPLWWIWASGAVLLSQILIIRQWKDARWGTFANAIVLVGCLIGWGNHRFDSRSMEERDALFEWADNTMTIQSIQTDEQLPEPVVRWLSLSGDGSWPSGKDIIHYRQTGRMLTEKGGNWKDFSAQQWFTTDVPGFLWNAHVGRGSFMPFSGRDKMVDGHGEMRIEAYSFITVVNASGPEIDQGVAIRYLSEIVWFPFAVRKPFIRWTSVDDRSAVASMDYPEGQVDVTFHFDKEGKVSWVEALRFNQDLNKLVNWRVELDPSSWKEINGVYIPTHASVSWDLPEGPFTWLEVDVLEN